MKKIGLALISISALALITGCGKEKSLECKMSNESSGIYQTYTLNFDTKDKFKSAKLVQDMKLSSDQTGNLELYKQTTEEAFKNNETTKNLKIKVTDNGKDTVTATVDFNAEDANKISGGNSATASYDDLKKALEDSGYTCK